MTHMHMLYNVQVESEVQMEQAQLEAFNNLALDQVKSRCIPPIIIVFYFESLLYNVLVCALSW
jgi:hypothetical protein